jgi:single-strand DNA-binding protein
MKYTPQGTPITTFSMAVSRTRKSPDGQMIDETEWFRIVAWERLAETCNEFLRKGSKVYIEGRLQTRKWQGQDGVERQMVEVVANEMVLLDSRQQGGAGGGYSEERQAPARQGGGSSSSYNDDADMDVDDIPF